MLTEIPIEGRILFLLIAFLYLGSIPWIEAKWRRIGLYVANVIADWAESEGPL